MDIYKSVNLDPGQAWRLATHNMGPNCLLWYMQLVVCAIQVLHFIVHKEFLFTSWSECLVHLGLKV